MPTYYYLAMYTVTNNGTIVADGSFFIQSPQFLNRQQIKDYIKVEEKYTTEIIMLSNVVEIGEDMFKELGGNEDTRCFKIA